MYINIKGNAIASQLLDVTIRVQAIRKFAVNEMSQLLEIISINNQTIYNNITSTTTTTSSTINNNNSTIIEVLYAAVWICGEFASELNTPELTLQTMLKYKCLPGHIQAIFVHNILKLTIYLVNKYHLEIVEQKTINQLSSYDRIFELINMVIDHLYNDYRINSDLEVQERAESSLQLLKIILKHYQMYVNKIIPMSDNNNTTQNNVDILTSNTDEEFMTENTQKDELKQENDIVDEQALKEHQSFLNEILQLFDGELMPVAAKAQRKVPIPDGYV